MTIAGLEPRTVAEIVTRAGRPDYDRWAEQVERCGHCARPVRLRGHIEHRSASGGRRVAYTTRTEPDRVLLIRCGNRRASACPSCSYEYAGDMWQLLYAGAAGGRKGVPQSIRSHPLVFATLTAPGFGSVHTTRTDRTGNGSARCRPARGKATLCVHGRPTWCNAVHAEEDPRLGQPICADCYDYPAHVAFNWHAPELWRRFTIAVRRSLARHAGLTAAEFGQRCRLSFVKVAEFQRRGVVHFHALIRLDGPGDFDPPRIGVDAAGLAEAIRQAAARVRLTVDMPDGSGLLLRFGDQLDTQTVNGGPAGELTAEHAARYIAKYATKSAEDFGLGDRRITPDALPLLGVGEHAARIVRVAWQLGGHEAYPGLRRWVHLLCFRGHFASKSRRYSTTLGAIRGERRAYRQRQAAEHVRELGAAEHDTTPDRRPVGVRRTRLPHQRRRRVGTVRGSTRTRATAGGARCRTAPVYIGQSTTDSRERTTVSTEQKTRLWGPAEVSEYLGISVNTLYQWRMRHYGPPGRRVGRHLRYRQADVMAWFESLDPEAA